MGLTSALNTALNGLGLNEASIDVIGNNIANAGTNGFKSSRVLFETQLSRTLSVGAAPDANTGSGGTNPRQVGLGAATAAIIQDFGQGGISTTTSPSDLAIEGDGFFILVGSEGTRYTRDGSFQLNSANKLVNNAGFRVQGYGVTESFQLTTELKDIEIPIGDLRVAQATKNIEMTGALRTSIAAEIGTQGTIYQSAALTDASTSSAITAASLLDDVFNGATKLFDVGDVISFAPRKGSPGGGRRNLAPAQFTVTSTATIAEFNTFLREALGIVDSTHPGAEGTIPNDASGDPPGVHVTPAGQLRIVGNAGTYNDLEFTASTFSRNGVSTTDFGFTKTQIANGESAFASFVVFDSLGDPIDLKMTAVLESRTTGSATYRYFFESVGDSDADTAVASGTISFDSDGKVTGSASRTITINRNDSNAATMDITVDFSDILGIVASSEASSLDLAFQDGSETGVLTTFNINEAGIINGVFDNGIIRPLGQIVLARFRNPQGLVEAGRSTFQEGVSSGERLLRTPGTGGAGSVRSGAIELSNTDVGRNLVDLIVASTNYRGNARVISSVQALVDELLVLGR